MSELVPILVSHRIEFYIIGFVCIFLLELYFSPSGTVKSHHERWIVNGAFTLINIFEPIIRILFVLTLSSSSPLLSLTRNLPLPMEVILSFVLISALAWFTHYLMHKIPVFWRIHQIHHSDIYLDSTSTARFHPFESILQFFLIFYPSVYVLGISGEIFIAFILIDSLSNLFIHSNLPLSSKLQKIIDLVWVTPHHHRIHHSSNPEHFDSNFGTTFSVWDRLFRTRSVSSEKVQFGTSDMPFGRPRSIFRMLLHPIIRFKDSL